MDNRDWLKKPIDVGGKTLAEELAEKVPESRYWICIICENHTYLIKEVAKSMPGAFEAPDKEAAHDYAYVVLIHRPKIKFM